MMLNRFLTRPGVRAAGTNFGWLVADKIVRLVLNVGMGFWVARYLGPVNFGSFSYAVALVGLVSVFAELGLEGIVRRELVRSPARAEPLLVTAAGLRLGGGILAYGVLWLLSGGMPAAERELALILGVGLLQPAAMVVELWFQARLAARQAVWPQWLALGAGAVGRIWLIQAAGGLAGFAWALVLESLLAAGILGGLAWRQGLRTRWALFDAGLAGRLGRESWPLLLSGFAVVLYLRIDVVMLRRMGGADAVGVYAAAVRFTEIWYFVPVALANSLLPAMLRAKEGGGAAYLARLQAGYDLNAALAYGLAVPLALAAPWLIGLAYGPAYAGAAPVLALHIWSSVFVFLGVARGQFLVNEGHTHFYLASTGAGLLVNVVLNLALIPGHGAWGAALATLVAQAVAAWISSFCFAPVRAAAWMQTRALLIPFRWFTYVRSR